LDAIQVKIRHLPETMFENKGLKGDAREKLRLNAIDSLLLWFVMSTGTPDADYVDLLYRHVWQERLKETPIKRPKAVLAEAKTPELLGWLTREFQRRMNEVARSTEEAERSSARARAKVEELERTLSENKAKSDQLSAEIAQLEATLDMLNTNLAEQQRLRSIDKTHHVDDYKGLRTRVQRSLDKQSELLRSALHALRNERLSVADEYVERSLDAIDSERERLKAQGD
jgi:septal ring factor EnvC (AmiA/AmiB activator)